MSRLPWPARTPYPARMCLVQVGASGEMTKRMRRSAALLLALGLTGINGCMSSAPLLAPDTPGKFTTYTLNSGDKLHITVFNEPTLSGDFVVTSDGNISFPLVGDVPVSGKSVAQTQELIRSRLAAGYVKDPRVTLEVSNYRPYYVLGEVGRPGEYVFSVGLTVTQAVAIAGGFSYRANQRHIFVKRAGEQVERQIDVSKHTAYILPGDTIRVGERYF